MDRINDTRVRRLGHSYYTCVSDNYDAEQHSDGTWVSTSIMGTGATEAEAIADYREQVLDDLHVAQWDAEDTYDAARCAYERGELAEASVLQGQAAEASAYIREVLEIEP